MATYRCPKHDLIFETLTDQRKPGALAVSNAKGTFKAHPVDGHPDCPKCEEEAQNEVQHTHSVSAPVSVRVSNRKVA